MPKIMSQDDSWYFAYGSNMSKQQMLRRTGSIPESLVACLKDYQLVFRPVLVGNDVFATIIPQDDAVVYGVAYRCSPASMLELDRFEGVAENCYRRASVQVTAENGSILDCIVYIGHAFSSEASFPSSSYWDLIQTGATEHRLPNDYINALTHLAGKSA